VLQYAEVSILKGILGRVVIIATRLASSVRVNAQIKGPRGFRALDPRSWLVGRALLHFVAPYARGGAILST